VSLSVIFLLDFGTVPTVWYILFFTLLPGRTLFFYQPFEALIEETQPFRFIERCKKSKMLSGEADNSTYLSTVIHTLI
jgi:hypothetical protein